MLLWLFMAAGCGGDSTPPPDASANAPGTDEATGEEVANEQVAAEGEAGINTDRGADKPAERTFPFPAPPAQDDKDVAESSKAPQRPTATKLSGAELAEHGLKRIESKHLSLITDVPVTAAIKELPIVFDRAVAPWCEYFQIDPAKLKDWQVTAYLMRDNTTFKELGLLPNHLPPFENGYAMARRLWLYEQKSDYYRRHLLLHEGTHSFMYQVFGTCGPSWYMEGMAELLATHRWQDNELKLGYFPKDRREVPLLGRIRMVQDEVAADRVQSLRAIMAYDGRSYLKKVPYGWSWAVCAFLDGHPKYQQRFHQLHKHLDPTEVDSDLTTEFRQAMDSDWQELNDEWRLFADSLEHNHDLVQTAIDFRPGKPLAESGRRVEISADRGWQSSGVHVEAGQTYRIAARGRYQIAQHPEQWTSEPGGVTIRYYRGQPLGILLASVRTDVQADAPASSDEGVTNFSPQPIGLETTWTPSTNGTLYLRINDSPAELDDNDGTLTVTIDRL